MHVLCLNPQGNFDATDRGWTEHPDFGGQLVYVKELARALAHQGHRVDLLTRRFDDPEWPEFASAEDRYPDIDGVRILRFPCGPEGFLPKEELWPYLAEWAERIAAYYADEGLPDALTGHYGDGGLAAALLSRRFELPVTFTAHSLGAQKLDKLLSEGMDFDAACERFAFEHRIAAERVSAGWAGRIIVSTELEQREQYAHRLYRGAIDAARDDRFAVVPPGVNLDVFGHDRENSVEAAVGEKIEAMLARDIPAQRRGLPVVVCSSRLDAKKNHLGLVRAWAADARLAESANLVLVIQGSSDPLRERDRVARGEARRILEAIVTLLDDASLWPAVSAFDLRNQAELAAGYRHLARHHRGIFALTTFYEPFGLAPLEAIAAGLPAVVTANGGPSESLRDAEGEYGVLVDPVDPEDVARGLRRLAEDGAEWERMRRAGLARVEARYTWHSTARGYLDALDAAAAERPAEPPPIPGWFLDPASGEAITRRWLRELYAEEEVLPG